MRVSTAGVVERDGTFLVALRKPGTSIGESWEFPGGKMEEGETPQQGLSREFKEEFNLEITVGEQFHESTFSNKGATYKLMAFWVNIRGGDMDHPEHQEIRWVSPEELSGLPMASSDTAIVRTLTALVGKV